MKLLGSIFDPRGIRERLRMSQEEFWTRIGVTQSGGSRYESGRPMPRPVRELLRLVHVEQLDLSTVRKEDFDIIHHMRTDHPDLYQSLKKALRTKRRRPDAARH